MDYDKNVKETFVIMSTYLTNVFYNNIYNNAKDKFDNDPGNNSMTDIYKKYVANYVKDIQNTQIFFQRSLQEVYGEFRKYNLYRSLSLHEFLCRFVKCFLPEEYHSALEKNIVRDQLLNKIFKSIVGEFAIKVLKFDNLKLIMDDRSKDKAKMLTGVAARIMDKCRERLFNGFIEELVGRPETELDSSMKKIRKLLKAYKDKVRELEVENAELRRLIEQRSSVVTVSSSNPKNTNLRDTSEHKPKSIKSSSRRTTSTRRTTSSRRSPKSIQKRRDISEDSEESNSEESNSEESDTESKESNESESEEELEWD